MSCPTVPNKIASVVLSVLIGVGLALTLPADPASADTPRQRQWWFDQLHLEEAQRITRGAGVTIGMVDTGVDPSHPDLAGADITGTDTWSSRRDGMRDVYAPYGHGTAMASLMVGRGNDGGILGVAPEAKLKVYAATYNTNPFHKGYDEESIAAGIGWLVEQRVDVILLAFGSSTSNTDAQNAALRSAELYGIPVIAAAGNTPGNYGPDDEVEFPAATPGVLAVGSTGRDGEFAEVSVHGKEMFVGAPGYDLDAATSSQVAHYNGEPYSGNAGTSDASAITAGVVALIAAAHPEASREEIVHRLQTTAVDTGEPGRDEYTGYGRIDPLAAITASVDPAEVPPAPRARTADLTWHAYSRTPGPVAATLAEQTALWRTAGSVAAVALVAVAVTWRRSPRVRWFTRAVASGLVIATAATVGMVAEQFARPPTAVFSYPEYAVTPPDDEGDTYLPLCKSVYDEVGLVTGKFLRGHRGIDPPSCSTEVYDVKIEPIDPVSAHDGQLDAYADCPGGDSATVQIVSGVITCTGGNVTVLVMHRRKIVITIDSAYYRSNPDTSHPVIVLMAQIVVDEMRKLP